MLSLKGKFDWPTHSISAPNVLMVPFCTFVRKVPFRIRIEHCPCHRHALIWLLPGHSHALEEVGKHAGKFCPSERASEHSCKQAIKAEENERKLDSSWTIGPRWLSEDIFIVPSKLVPMGQWCALCVVHVCCAYCWDCFIRYHNYHCSCCCSSHCAT